MPVPDYEYHPVFMNRQRQFLDKIQEAISVFEQENGVFIVGIDYVKTNNRCFLDMKVSLQLKDTYP